MDKISNLIKSFNDLQCPFFRYYICHVLISLLMATPVLLGYDIAILFGPVFYTIREIVQRYQLGYWDHKGWIYPVVVNSILFLLWLGIYS